jgi:hypothetical protein
MRKHHNPQWSVDACFIRIKTEQGLQEILFLPAIKVHLQSRLPIRLNFLFNVFDTCKNILRIRKRGKID